MGRYDRWRERMDNNPYAKEAKCVICKHYCGSIKTVHFCNASGKEIRLNKPYTHFNVSKPMICSKFLQREEQQ